MQAGNNPDPALREGYLRSFNKEGIHHNLDDVGRKLGMALVSTVSRPSGYNVRPRCAVGAIGGGGGLTLAEVVGVVMGNIHPGKLDGTITVTDGFGALQLYNHTVGAPRGGGQPCLHTSAHLRGRRLRHSRQPPQPPAAACAGGGLEPAGRLIQRLQPDPQGPSHA